MRAGEESDDTQTAYRVAAFQTFFSGRISTFGDTGWKKFESGRTSLIDTREQGGNVSAVGDKYDRDQ